MATCEICGTTFDEHGVQIVVPGLANAFDRVDCAVRARNLAGAAGAGVPMRGTLVDLARGDARSFALGGLSAGLAAALAASRARLAVSGATVGVALLVATTAHLATRGGGEAESTSGPEGLASPTRYAGDSADRLRTVEAARPAVERRPEPAVTFVLAAATPSADEPRAARSIRTVTRTHTQRPKATRHARGGGGKTTKSSSSASTRPGWGHGDKNHGHNGPSKQHEAAAKQGKAHKHK